jgi:hypothetical protein
MLIKEVLTNTNRTSISISAARKKHSAAGPLRGR